MAVLTRKKFICSLAGASGLLAVPLLLSGQQVGGSQGYGQQLPKQDRPTKGPALDKELVKEFVAYAHKDFDKVRTMLQETPDLLNSVHNLGGWDWEDALGAAGHVGLRDMAVFLLQQGARPTICVAAMLGELELVKAFIQAFPDMKNAVGPHKISLVRHAKAGGEKSAKVLDYLISIGAKE